MVVVMKTLSGVKLRVQIRVARRTSRSFLSLQEAGEAATGFDRYGWLPWGSLVTWLQRLCDLREPADG
jgi:hypothetical protein